MRNQLLSRTALTALGLSAFLFVSAGPRFAAAEKVNMSPEAMRDIATDVILGKVVSIGQTTEPRGEFIYTHYTAHVEITKVEKGTSLQKGGFCDARYWHRNWKPGEGPRKVGNNYMIPASGFGAFGHRGLPKVGDTRRVYLARNAYDGYTYDNKDGGYSVIGPNGFENPAAPEKHGSPRGMRPYVEGPISPQAPPVKMIPLHP